MRGQAATNSRDPFNEGRACRWPLTDPVPPHQVWGGTTHGWPIRQPPTPNHTTEQGARDEQRYPPQRKQPVPGSNGGERERVATLLSPAEHPRVTARGRRRAHPRNHRPGALHWDALAPVVSEALAQPLETALVSQRKGRGGRQFSYIEGHTAIDQANQVFGYGGWGYELVGDVTMRTIKSADSRTG